VEQFKFPVLLGTPVLSKFKCSLHFDDDHDPYFELKAEGTAKKEQVVAFLEEEEVLLISEAIHLVSKETVAKPPGMEMLVNIQISKRIRSLLRHDSLNVWMTNHTGRVQQSGIFVGKGLGSLRDAVNVLAIANFSDKEVVVRTGEIAAYAVPLNLDEFGPLSFDEREQPFWKERWKDFLGTHEEVTSAEGVSLETSMLNVEEKSKLALVLAVFDEVFQQTLSPESKAKGYDHHVANGDHPPIRNRCCCGSPAEKDLIKTEVQKLV
jgi:hypothetical protein